MRTRVGNDRGGAKAEVWSEGEDESEDGGGGGSGGD